MLRCVHLFHLTFFVSRISATRERGNEKSFEKVFTIDINRREIKNLALFNGNNGDNINRIGKYYMLFFEQAQFLNIV